MRGSQDQLEPIKWVDSSTNASLPSSAIGVPQWRGITQQTHDTFADITKNTQWVLQAPSNAATEQDRLEFIGQQLDSLSGATLPICGGLVLKQGMHSRMQGGVLLA